MKFLLLTAWLLAAFTADAQDYSGTWTGESNILFNRPVYTTVLVRGKPMVVYSSGNYFSRIVMQLEQSGSMMTGTVKYEYNNEPSMLMHEISGLIMEKHAVLTEGEVLKHARVSHYYFATFEGDITNDSAKGKMIMKGKIFDRYHKLYNIWTKEVRMLFISTYEFVLTKPINNPKPARKLPEKQPFTAIPEPRKRVPPVIVVPENDWKERAKTVAQTVEVTSDSLQLSFYDDGEIDGDTVSVYFNGNMLIGSKLLTAQPLVIKIPLVPGTDNEIVMYALNEGSIPPNTALLVFYDNGIRREIRIASDNRTSGTVIFRRK